MKTRRQHTSCGKTLLRRSTEPTRPSFRLVFHRHRITARLLLHTCAQNMHFTSTRTKPRSLAHPFIHSCHVQLLSHTTINRYPQAEIKEAKQQISDLQEMVMLQRQVRYERARSTSMSSLSPSVGEETAVAASGPKEKTLRTVRLCASWGNGDGGSRK